MPGENAAACGVGDRRLVEHRDNYSLELLFSL